MWLQTVNNSLVNMDQVHFLDISHQGNGKWRVSCYVSGGGEPGKNQINLLLATREECNGFVEKLKEKLDIVKVEV